LERLEKGKRLNKDITGLNLDGSGRPHLDVHPLPAARLMMGKDALFSRATSSKTIRYTFVKNAA